MFFNTKLAVFFFFFFFTHNCKQKKKLERTFAAMKEPMVFNLMICININVEILGWLNVSQLHQFCSLKCGHWRLEPYESIVILFFRQIKKNNANALNKFPEKNGIRLKIFAKCINSGHDIFGLCKESNYCHLLVFFSLL